MSQDCIAELARKYIWWKESEGAVSSPRRVVAQVMNIGDYDDVQALLADVGEGAFRNALTNAQPGEFNARSWHYWHYRLGLARLDAVPPLPERQFRGAST